MRRGLAVVLAAGGSLLALRAQQTPEGPSMEEFRRLLATPVITASRMEEAADLAPATIYVISEEDIVRNGYLELKDALETVPGFTGIDPSFFLFGGQRGFLGNLSQTLILVDGREMQNLIAAETFISHQFATHNIKQIEVIQGPGSALYGANALVGVINLITKSGSRDFEGAEVQAEWGSAGAQGTSLVFARSSGEWRLSGSLRDASGDGYDFGRFVNDPLKFAEGYSDVQRGHIDATHRFHNKYAAQPLTFRLDWRGFYAGREAYRLDTRKGLERVALDYETLADHRELTLDYLGWAGAVDPSTDLSLELNRYRERYWSAKNAFDATTYAALYPGGGPISDADVHRYFTSYSSQENSSGSKREKATLQVTRRFHSGGNLILGLVYDWVDIMGIAQSTTDPSPPFDETLSPANPLHSPYNRSHKRSLFAQVKRGFFEDRLLLTLGERLDDQSILGAVWTARGGVVWRYGSRGSLKALYGEAFREPTLFEQGADVPGLFNPDLKPARMRTFELGVDHTFAESWAGSLTLYRNLARDLIVPIDTHHFRNAEGIRGVSGAEAKLTWGAGWRIHGDVGGAYTDAGVETFAGTEVRDLGVYRVQGNAAVNVDLAPEARLNLRVVHYGAMDAKHGNPALPQVIRLPAATKVSLTLSSGWVPLGGLSMRYVLTAHNALDAEVLQPNVRRGGPKQFRQPGREVFGRLAFRF